MDRLKGPTSPIRLTRLAAWGLVLAVGIVVVGVAPFWYFLLAPRWLLRALAIGFLWALLAVIVAAVPAAPFGLFAGIISACRGWRRDERDAALRALRWTLLAASCVAGLIMMESASAVLLRCELGIAELPTKFPARAKSNAGGDLYLVVVGESSAMGEPYGPWVSVGPIVAWQLERVFPGRKIRVDVRAEGGMRLEQAIRLLRDLRERPDAVIVFAGHNEFQNPYGWARTVRHYVDEGPESALALVDLVRSSSATGRLILATMDRYRGEAAPPPYVTRELVDHPICTPRERAFVLYDYTRRLSGLADYCDRIGAIPILIALASNLGSFEPNRSILDARAGARERAAFSHDFQAVRAAESGNPEAAIAGYRRLLKRHPEFAESHYRLARLLAGAGCFDEAREHDNLARDLDAFPLRCPSDFLQAVRTVAERYDAILIDASALLSRMVPDGIVDDRLFHDAQHMNLAGYVAVAHEILVQLEHRKRFGWPASVPAPLINLAECARHFGLNEFTWSEVCVRSATFYARSAYVRHDASERLKVIDRYKAASLDLRAGRPLAPDHPPSLNLAVPILDRAVAPAPKEKASRRQCATESREADSRRPRAPALPVPRETVEASTDLKASRRQPASLVF